MSEFINKGKGRVKQAVGSLIGDKKLKAEGARDERRGQVEGAAKDVKHAAKGAVKDTKHAIREVTK